MNPPTRNPATHCRLFGMKVSALHRHRPPLPRTYNWDIALPQHLVQVSAVVLQTPVANDRVTLDPLKHSASLPYGATWFRDGADLLSPALQTGANALWISFYRNPVRFKRASARWCETPSRPPYAVATGNCESRRVKGTRDSVNPPAVSEKVASARLAAHLRVRVAVRAKSFWTIIDLRAWPGGPTALTALVGLGFRTDWQPDGGRWLGT
ncbi:hypothetical protein MRX96_030614 [Rhipicephalus microplus]